MVETIGLIEKVKIHGKLVKAKVDTGAESNSIDMNLAAELEMGPIIGVRDYVSSHGRSTRPIVKGIMEIKGKRLKVRFNLYDRSELKYPVLIGQRTLKMCGFLIDPNKK